MKNTSKWVIAALSVSLMVNVFAAGHFFSRDIRRGPKDDRIELSRTLPRGALAAMPEDARKAFRQALLSSRDDIRESRRDAREARRAVASAMVQDGALDEAAIAANFERLRALNAKQQEGFESALIAALKRMTPEERQAFAQTLRKRAEDKSDMVRDKMRKRLQSNMRD